MQTVRHEKRTGSTEHRLGQLPNLFVAGPAKTGTSALYHYFRVHPQVYTTPIKETNYMAFCDGLPPLRGPGDQERIAAKSIIALADYRALYAKWRDERVAADVSPTYMHYPRAVTRIAELCPRANIVIVLRNPVECAFSMYSMLRRDGLETCRTFREAMDRGDERRVAGWAIKWDPKRMFRVSDAVARYVELFPRSQLFIRRYELLKMAPAQFYEELCDFLKIEPIDVSQANRRRNAGATRRDLLRAHIGGRALLRMMKVGGLFFPGPWRRSLRHKFLEASALELSASDRKALVDYYADEISKLSQLMSWDLSEWLKC